MSYNINFGLQKKIKRIGGKELENLVEYIKINHILNIRIEINAST